MEALLGFRIGFWDYATFLSLFVIVAAGLGFDDPDPSRFPLGAQGAAAIYTGDEHGAWAALRKISIRAHSWANWLYPINF